MPITNQDGPASLYAFWEVFLKLSGIMLSKKMSKKKRLFKTKFLLTCRTWTSVIWGTACDKNIQLNQSILIQLYRATCLLKECWLFLLSNLRKIAFNLIIFWTGLNPLCVCAKSLHLCQTVCNPVDHSLTGSSALCPRDSPGKNTEVGCHALLQGVFLT